MLDCLKKKKKKKQKVFLSSSGQWEAYGSEAIEIFEATKQISKQGMFFCLCGIHCVGLLTRADIYQSNQSAKISAIQYNYLAGKSKCLAFQKGNSIDSTGVVEYVPSPSIYRMI